jgi:hypothetical protein
MWEGRSNDVVPRKGLHVMSIIDSTEIVRRATRAYARLCTEQGTVFDQPAAHASDVEDHEGGRFVVLRNMQRTLAVYRLRADSSLRALSPGKWPQRIASELESSESATMQRVISQASRSASFFAVRPRV